MEISKFFVGREKKGQAVFREATEKVPQKIEIKNDRATHLSLK